MAEYDRSAAQNTGQQGREPSEEWTNEQVENKRATHQLLPYWVQNESRSSDPGSVSVAGVDRYTEGAV